MSVLTRMLVILKAIVKQKRSGLTNKYTSPRSSSKPPEYTIEQIKLAPQDIVDSAGPKVNQSAENITAYLGIVNIYWPVATV